MQISSGTFMYQTDSHRRLTWRPAAYDAGAKGNLLKNSLLPHARRENRSVSK